MGGSSCKGGNGDENEEETNLRGSKRLRNMLEEVAFNGCLVEFGVSLEETELAKIEF